MVWYTSGGGYNTVIKSEIIIIIIFCVYIAFHTSTICLFQSDPIQEFKKRQYLVAGKDKKAVTNCKQSEIGMSLVEF